MDGRVQTILDTTPDRESFVKQELRKDPTIYFVKAHPFDIPPGEVSEFEYVAARETAIENYLRENKTAKRIEDLLARKTK